MLNNQLKSDLHKQQLLPILNTTNLESDIARLKKYLNHNKSVEYIEITLREKESFSIAVELKKYFSDCKFGLGSVLSKEDLIRGQDHNFNFYVSPGIIEEILEMYNNNQLLKNTDARMWLSRQLKRIHIYELNLIMPWLVGLCIKNHNIAYETLIPLCISDLQLAYSFYFELNFYLYPF